MSYKPWKITLKFLKLLGKIAAILQFKKIYVRHAARAYLYDPKRNKFLIARGFLPPRVFHTPGGGVSKRETNEEALRRELYEELEITSKDIVRMEYLDSVDGYAYFVPQTSHLFFVEINDPEGEIPRKVSPELVEVEWVDFDQMVKCVGNKGLDKAAL